MGWRFWRRGAAMYDRPRLPRRCGSSRCDLIAGHPLPHYRLTGIESGWGGWHRQAWATWPPGAGDDYPLHWTWPFRGTMEARLRAKGS